MDAKRSRGTPTASWAVLAAVVVAVALIGVACGGSDELASVATTSEPTEASATTTAPASTPDSPPTTNESILDDACTDLGGVLLPGGGVTHCVGPAVSDTGVIESATARYAEPNGHQIDLVFTPDGIVAFNALAATCFNRQPTCPTGQVAIAAGGRVVTAPTIQTPSFDNGEIVITGQFTAEEAATAAAELVDGELRPVLLTLP